MFNAVESLESRRLLAATITGRAFEDANTDGVYAAATDKRLAGVTAYVDLNADGKYQSTEPHAVTDAGGAYTIAAGGLTVGKSYALGFVFAAGYTQSKAVAAVTLASGAAAAPDAGAWRYATVTIDGFLDPNDNGIQDVAETTVPSDVTYWDDANQNNIPEPGEAHLSGNGTMTLKPGLHLIWPQYTGYGYELTGVNTLYLTVASGQAITQRLGYFQPATYTGHVYQDTNHNGKFDPGEGLGNRFIFADNNHNGIEDGGDYVDQTAPDGSYRWGLTIGTFTIRETTPKGWADAAPLSITVKSGTSAVSSGHDLESHAVATASTGVITGTVFTDLNGNGKQDSGETAYTGSEPPTPFIDVDHDNQYDPDLEQEFQCTGTGTFTISNLKPGTYQIGIYGDGKSTTTDHTVVVSAGKTASAGAFGQQQFYRVNVGVFVDTNRDGKYQVPTFDNADHQLGGDNDAPGRVVYIDANNNGKRDSNEDYAVSDPVFGSGNAFNLPAGTYTFREELPAGWYETGRIGNGLTASATFVVDGKLKLPADVPGASSVSAGGEFGVSFLTAPALAIHGQVFNDANGNGKQDAGEGAPTISGGGFIFADANNNGQQNPGDAGNLINSDGTFSLYVLPGTYTVHQVLTTGWTQTAAANATFTVGKLTTSVPTVVLGRHAGAAATKFFSVGGWAIVDDNKNGKYDEPEGENSETSTWAVYVDTNHNGDFDDGDLYSSYVNDRGLWGFFLPSDGKTYRVTLRNESNRALTSPTYYDVSSTTDGQSVSLFFGLSPDNSPAADPQTASISGFAFNDDNKDGQYQSTEVKTSSKTVFLDTNNNGKPDAGERSVVTAANGAFSFTGLAAGTYHVRRIFPTGYTDSTPPIDLILAAGQTATGLLIGSKTK